MGVGGWAKGRPLTKLCQDPETERLKMCGHNVWYCEREGQSVLRRGNIFGMAFAILVDKGWGLVLFGELIMRSCF